MNRSLTPRRGSHLIDLKNVHRVRAIEIDIETIVVCERYGHRTEYDNCGQRRFDLSEHGEFLFHRDGRRDRLFDI